MKKDLLKLIDLSREDIFTILDLADQLKYDVKHGIPHRKLEGKVLAMMFAKNSTRTRVSFETADRLFEGTLFSSRQNAEERKAESGKNKTLVLKFASGET